VPADVRGAKPRLEGEITVAIHDHRLAITETAMAMRDVSEPIADTTRDCVAGKAVGLAVPAPDQDDLDNYAISIAYAIP
jgi:hypothetical protein